METEVPAKVYTVKCWEVRLKSGSTATYNIREDLGQSFVIESPWMVWRWPAMKKESKILLTEVAAVDYEEIERKELKLYKPKKGVHGSTKEGPSIDGHNIANDGTTTYVPRTKADEEAIR